MTEQNAPTCRNCGGDSSSGRTSSGNHTEPESCIRALAARLAPLEAVVKQMGPPFVVSAPAEPTIKQTFCTACRGLGDSVVCGECGHGLPVPPQPPTAEPARCEPCKFWCGRLARIPDAPWGDGPFYVGERTSSSIEIEHWCTPACRDAGRPLNPAAESTPDVPGATGKDASAAELHEAIDSLTGPGGNDIEWTHAEHVLRTFLANLHEPWHAPDVQPIPQQGTPRPEGQGTVTHEDAASHLKNITSHRCAVGISADDVLTLERYVVEQAAFARDALKAQARWEARDKAQADEIAALKSHVEYVVRGRDEWAQKTIDAEDESAKLRAELAALKQPVPVTGTAPAQAVGTGNRERARAWYAEGMEDHPHELASDEEVDSLAALLDEAEQRGRASRDGMVPEVAAWRQIGNAERRLVISYLRQVAAESLAHYSIAARALEALASDAGKDGGR